MLQILIVDDARSDLMFAEATLRRCKILNPFLTMTEGGECIRYFERAAVDAQPCLLFLDLNMYPINGAAVMEAIGQTDLGKKSIVVMLSGIQDIKSVRAGYQLGAKTFLIKPLAIEDVMAFLQTVEDRIRVNKREEGYELEWIRDPELATQPSSRLGLGSVITQVA
jgi:CheY-like chemotaxis protein